MPELDHKTRNKIKHYTANIMQQNICVMCIWSGSNKCPPSFYFLYDLLNARKPYQENINTLLDIISYTCIQCCQYCCCNVAIGSLYYSLLITTYIMSTHTKGSRNWLCKWTILKSTTSTKTWYHCMCWLRTYLYWVLNWSFYRDVYKTPVFQHLFMCRIMRNSP